MLKVHARADIGEIPLLLMESRFCFCVIYGMEQSTFTVGRGERDKAAGEAWEAFRLCMDHAATCAGLLDGGET